MTTVQTSEYGRQYTHQIRVNDLAPAGTPLSAVYPAGAPRSIAVSRPFPGRGIYRPQFVTGSRVVDIECVRWAEMSVDARIRAIFGVKWGTVAVDGPPQDPLVFTASSLRQHGLSLRKLHAGGARREGAGCNCCFLGSDVLGRMLFDPREGTGGGASRVEQGAVRVDPNGTITVSGQLLRFRPDPNDRITGMAVAYV